MNQNKKNVAHSIFQRLLNRAKTNKEDFNLLLSRYGMERFLYRLSLSPHNDRFILKGASLFLAWKGQNYRVTRDVDLLGFVNSDIEQIADLFCDICRVEFQGDGMIYLSGSLNAEEIRKDQEYDGVRITLVGILNQARIPLQIDIGFGIVSDPKIGAKMFENMPRIAPGSIQGLHLMPLESSTFLPDVVIVEDEVEKLMWIALAYLHATGGERVPGNTAVLQAACVDSTLIPYLEKRLNYGFSCYGCRDATDIGPGEALVGFSGGWLKAIGRHLEYLAEKAIPSSRSKKAYRSLRPEGS